MKSLINFPNDVNHTCVIMVQGSPMLAYVKEMSQDVDPETIPLLNPVEYLKKNPPDIIVRFTVIGPWSADQELFGTFIEPQEIKE
jgi:hypothetical protein